MPNKRMEETKDLWLFQCYTGLSYIDMASLTPEDYKKADNGMYYIKKKRQKTGVEFTTILLKDATFIALKYKFNLPVKSNQRLNSYLKELADLCGIEKTLHTHMARHTAAMYFFNYRPQIPTETIKKIFGWSDDRQVKIYAKILDTTVFEDVAKMETEDEKFAREMNEIMLLD